MLELNGTLLELNVTLIELNGTLLELNVTLLELDGALLELNVTLLENNRTQSACVVLPLVCFGSVATVATVAQIHMQI